MILLPDYPDKVILAHRIRVERLALLGTLTLIGTGAWWLLPAMDGSAELLPRMGPVVVMFTAALLLADLIEYPAAGATLLAEAGSEEFVVRWAAQHHLRPDEWTVDSVRARVLRRADSVAD